MVSGNRRFEREHDGLHEPGAAELGQGELLVPVCGPPDGPLGGEEQQLVALVVLHQHGVSRQGEVFRLEGLVPIVVDPAEILVGEALAVEVHAVLVFQPVLQHIELQGAHHAHDHLFHAGIGGLEDLDGALLGDLFHALQKLLALHGVQGTDSVEVLRGESGEGVEGELAAGGAEGVPDGEDAGIEDADDVAGV